ncbi:uncharacterized protein LOC143059438 [Mytilus galloprovincialis]|uniref:uncharacterized protein LOC143059438 n=1 Tax=Mytilus galloprovincialis TaxID=29158 RepID=UPI003F7C40FE
MVCNCNTNCTTDECSDDVTDINTCDCDDKNIISTESGLLPKNFTDFYICSTHFNQLLKRNSDLRRRKVCQLPTLISAHPPVASHSVFGVKKPKPSRNITINDVEKIQKCYGLTLPIGTLACTSCLIKISKQSTEIEAESLDQGKCEDDQIQQCTKLNTDDEIYLMETDELDVLTEKENICDNLHPNIQLHQKSQEVKIIYPSHKFFDINLGFQTSLNKRHYVLWQIFHAFLAQQQINNKYYCKVL